LAIFASVIQIVPALALIILEVIQPILILTTPIAKGLLAIGGGLLKPLASVFTSSQITLAEPTTITYPAPITEPSAIT